MSELTPSLVPLDKGLNLQTAKLVAPPGSVLDTLNYEQVDFQGQKRIDGFNRYDGSHLAAFDDYYKITLTDDFAVSGNVVVSVEDGIFGRLVGLDANPKIIYVAVIDANLIPEVGDTLYYINGGANEGANVVTAVTTGVASGATVNQHYTQLLESLAELRSRVMELPGPVAGLHWFRDRLYAVAQVTVASLEGTTPAIYPNDMLSINGAPEVTVLDSFVRDNTRIVFLSDMYPEDWATEGLPVTRNSLSVGAIANGFESLTTQEEIASFYVALSEQQAIDEGTYWGWNFINQGWSVNFEDGLSLFGSLPSLNQNITGLGVQGPTSVAGNNGAPLILTQKVDITNEVDQVNGWKSSQTPTTYELESDNLLETDDDTIYADAYVSWNGTTTEVVGITNPLVEYAASNTVTIELP